MVSVRDVASPEEAEGNQHLAGARGRVRTNVSHPSAGSGGFLVYFNNTKSCILMHSLAPKMGTTSVFTKTLTKTHWGK